MMTAEITLTLTDLALAAYFILPAYAANSAPIIFGGGLAMDFGKKFIDGERIFGSNKTVRGFLSGIICGSSVALAEGLIIREELALVGFLVSLGALLGDLFCAFIKRRLKLPPGFPLPLMDQLDFIFGAFLLSCPVYKFSLGAVFLILLITPPIHVLTNALAYMFKLKKAFW
jgi:CDP-2,3-bis-(O-geranylgeranyl)-sn-glycerol synthase